ncbi:unnamed protein product [Gemmataceae bacterium]|nr:unnamed protein product [Gemmataceae bacterium]VTU02453.1 unnamed protein product [Gemmataceae bacterium]
MSDTAPATQTVPPQTYRGRVVPTEQPWDGIPMAVAARHHHIAPDTLWKLIDAGDLRWGLGSRRRRRNGSWFTVNCVLVSRAGVVRATQTLNTARTRPLDATTEAPADGEPVSKLAGDFGVGEDSIRAWCGWDSHPALGRKVTSGTGTFGIAVSDGRQREWRGLLVSRADVGACVAAKNDPCHYQFPGNPGEWLAEGVFQHADGRLFLTEAVVVAKKKTFGLARGMLRLPVYRKAVEVLPLAWPKRGRGDRWSVLTYSRNDLLKLVEARGGKTADGSWLVPGIWADADGQWFTCEFVVGKGKVKHYELSRARQDGSPLRGVELRHFKRVPRKGAGSSPIVHHQSEAMPLMGLRSPAPPPGALPMSPAFHPVPAFDRPIPVIVVGPKALEVTIAGGAAPPASRKDRAAAEIVSHGGRCYSLGGGDQKVVSPSEDDVLQAFLEVGTAMDTATLQDRSGVDNVALVVGKLVKRFGDAVRTPKGKKNGGGYLVRVRRAEPE